MSDLVLTAGETMALLDPVDDEEPHEGSRFVLRFAGAESNYAIGLSRLGVGVRWVSRVGADPLGAMICRTLEAEGVDLRWVREDAEAPTGLFLKWRADGAGRNLYFRRGSAASRLAPPDVPDAALDGVRLVHLTGITVALSDTARDHVLSTARRAHDRGIPLSFDPNFRPALWRDPAAAWSAQREILPLVSWYLCGLEEGRLMTGAGSAEELFALLEGEGVGNVVVRVGARGALVRAGGEIVEVPPARVVDVRDEVGAGDGFAAGFSWALLRGLDSVACVRAGNAMAASALRGTGDWETYLRLEELEAELAA